MLIGGLVQLLDREDPRGSDTTLLAAALITLGYPPASDALFHFTCEFHRGETRWTPTWTFHAESREHAIQGLGADTVKAAWEDPSGMWLLRNVGHPVATLREGLRYDRLGNFTPRFSRAQLAQIATPDTWLEAGYRNLVHLLRHLPLAVEEARVIERFGPRWAAFVPRCLPEAEKTRRLKFCETQDYDRRRSILRAA